ncbi:MAG: hypothetical protein V7K92_08430 [Nostoc sp.]
MDNGINPDHESEQRYVPLRGSKLRVSVSKSCPGHEPKNLKSKIRGQEEPVMCGSFLRQVNWLSRVNIWIIDY